MKKNQAYLSIVIAAFNEEENIKDLTIRIGKALRSIHVPYELVYVIAGTDKTLAIVKQLQKNMPQIRYHYSQQPGGLGNDFKKGFSMVSSNSTYVLTMDADLNHQPEEIIHFLEAMKRTNADIVIGSREAKGAHATSIPAWKRFVSHIANMVFTVITFIRIKDKTSGYRLYKNEIIQKIAPKITSKNFEFLMEILLVAQRSKYHMVEIPITFTYRIHGKSKMNLLKTGCGYLKLLLRYAGVF